MPTTREQIIAEGEKRGWVIEQEIAVAIFWTDPKVKGSRYMMPFMPDKLLPGDTVEKMSETINELFKK